jgi:glycine/D-amino acid oxidase-like deaminating enzyme
MFKAFEQICTDLGILTLDTIALEVDFHFSCVSTQTGPVNFNHLIVALGSNSSSVLPPNTIQNLVQGVGTAIEIRKHGNLGYFSQQNSVIRTVNRGGAQCGFHFVPRNEGYYLGAGNYIKTTGQSSHRLETISYLIKTFEHELCGNDISYKLEGNLVKGHRPRSIDGFPLIGYLNKNPKVFVATGTNRAGLTWAPKIANQIVTWAKGDYDNSPFQSLVAPDRELINFGNWNEATSYYAESRLGAAVEHEKIAYTVNELKIEGQRLQQHANELLSKVQNVIKDKNAIPHPDHWALISESPSVYNAIR